MGQSELNTIFLPDEQSSTDYGQQLVVAVLGHLPVDRAFVINLSGPLGAGKTTLARAMLHGAGVTGHVRSPTYTLVESYDTAASVQFVHIDLYRIDGDVDAEGLGLRDYDCTGSVWLVEWPERAAVATQVDIAIELEYKSGGRQLRIAARSKPGEDTVAALNQ